MLITAVVTEGVQKQQRGHLLHRIHNLHSNCHFLVLLLICCGKYSPALQGVDDRNLELPAP